MTAPLYLVAAIGSLRRGSVNRVVFESATELVPAGVTLVEVPIADVPLFNQDLEGDLEPAAVVALKEAVALADGLIFFTPEYNRGVPAVTKNTLDWLSRPVGAGPMANKPVGIVASSPGGRGGANVRDHLAQSAGAITDRLFADALGIARVGDAITDGRLTDADVRDQLAEWLVRFVEHTGAIVAKAQAS